jgi:RHS repeat-associated protein
MVVILAGLADHFSARFTRTVTLAAGRYRFTVTTDDGSRLWVDQQLTIDAWWPQGSTAHTAEVDLGAGEHMLRYEYFEQTSGATARLTWAVLTPVVLASGEWLWENQSRVSLDGAYRLQYQGDGNLVVVRLADDSCAWSSQTNGASVWVTVMQGDGNLVVYDADGVPVWNSGTAGYDGARLEIANDTMAVVGPDETTRWSVSLAAASVQAAAQAAALAGGAPRGVVPVLALVLALAAFGRAAWRWTSGLRPSARLHPSGCGGQAASREPAFACQASAGKPRAVSRVAQLPASALLLTAMLLVPATALAQIPTQEVEYYHTDVLGSVRAVTKQVNGQWQVVARHDFMPFGEEIAPPVPPQEKRLFTGKERDSETGLDYFGARHYRADIGRFTTVDPKPASARPEVPETFNRYAYARNNPLLYVDPDGREAYKIFITATLAATGDWQGAKATAEKAGHTLTIYQGPDANIDNWNAALGDPDARVVLAGHTSHPPLVSTRNAVPFGQDLSAGGVAQIGGRPVAVPIRAGDVAIFGCSSADLASQYSMTNYVGVRSGSDGVSDLATLGDAAARFVAADAIARPGPGTKRPPQPRDPIAVANGPFRSSKKRMDDGDVVVAFPLKRQGAI